MALELQHTRSQPASQVLADRPEVANKIRKNHGSKRVKDMRQENAPLLEVTSLKRKPSIGESISLFYIVRLYV